MTAECKICGCELAISISGVYDDRYGYPGHFDLYRCRRCGHRSLDVQMSPEDISSLYTEYYPRSAFDLTRYSPAKEIKGFRSWLNGEKRSAYCWVPEGVRVLDIGCGFGETLGYHKARKCEVYGVEADENIRRVAEKFGFKVHVGIFDPDKYAPDYFDYVTMDQVIEHVTDPLATMRGIAKVMKIGGTAILSTPNAGGWGARLFGRRWINWHAPYHIQHFSRTSMTFAAQQAGLSVEKVKTITSSEWLYYQWIHLLTCPDTGEPSPFWSQKRIGGAKTKLFIKILSRVHLYKINHIITRFFDALGIGDNYLFFLRKNG
jgi:2-polyprenyl-3-methyl-5-hydroxy-6-metoxy-1,4-benzoquinol methylase